MKINCPECHGNFLFDHDNVETVLCPYCNKEINLNKIIEATSFSTEEINEKKEQEIEQKNDNLYSSGMTLEEVEKQVIKPLGVRFIAATMGLLGLFVAIFFFYEIIQNRVSSANLTITYLAIALSLFVSFVMFFLYHYAAFARILTILICTLSVFNSGRTILQIFLHAEKIPINVVLNYGLRFLFSFYFLIYLFSPKVKEAFLTTKNEHK